jgi:multiple sugar transport system permease protein
MNSKDLMKCITILVMMLLIVWTILPIISLIILSIAKFGTIPVGFQLPTEVTIENYRNVIFGKGNLPSLIPALLNSLIIASLTTSIVLLVSIWPAYAASSFGTKVAMTAYFLTIILRIVPPTTMGVPYYIMFSKLMLLDTYLGVSLADAIIHIPLAIWILKGFFDTIPKDLEEQALIDGASFTQVLIRVILPTVLPGLLTVTLLSFLESYTCFVFPLMLGRGSVDTVSIRIAGSMASSRVIWTDAAAVSITSMIPVILIYIVGGKYILKGIIMGAVKR